MKFIDESDVERVNQTLNFETADCKITGGCDIYTTKPIASDKKLYKTIDQHLESIIQENETYEAILKQRQEHEARSSSEGSNPLADSPPPNTFSFWEQKRRMSVTDSRLPGNYPFSPNSQNASMDGPTPNHTDMDPPVGSPPTSFITSSKIDKESFMELLKGAKTEPTINQRTPTNLDVPSKTPASPPVRRSSSPESPHHRSKSPRVSKKGRRSSLNTSNITLNLGPFGPLNQPSSRKTFASLISILNSSYQDHDFSSLEPTDFTKIPLKTFISKFDNSLSSMGKKPDDSVWETINTHMSLGDCTVYEYNPVKSFLEDETGYLWSTIAFLFNKKRKRVAFMYLICSRRRTSSGDVGEDVMKPRRNLVLDDYEPDLEGEYDLVNDEVAISDESVDDLD